VLKCFAKGKDYVVWSFIITLLVTAVSLLIISRLNVGIEVDSVGTALIAGLVIGLINAFIAPIVQLLALPLTILTLGLFALIINVLLFWAAAALVSGFRLRNGFVSALIGALLVAILNTLIFWILGALGLV
jgi:putative membrane protein